RRGFLLSSAMNRIIAMNRTIPLWVRAVATAAGALACVSLPACGTPASPMDASDLRNRAYIVSRDSDDLTVIDLNRLEIVGVVHTAGIANHMAELNADFTKLYVDSEGTDES